jgi:hypothetical protein
MRAMRRQVIQGLAGQRCPRANITDPDVRGDAQPEGLCCRHQRAARVSGSAHGDGRASVASKAVRVRRLVLERRPQSWSVMAVLDTDHSRIISPHC